MDAKTAQLATEAAELVWDESVYSSVFKVSPTPFLLAEVETQKVIDANTAAIQLFGHPAEELLGMSLGDLAADGDRIRCEMQKYAQEGKSYSMRLRWGRPRQGAPFPCEVQVSFFRHGGRLVAAVAVQDISKRHYLEKEVRNYKLAIDAVGEAVALVDEARKIVYTNRSFDLLFGKTEDELIGRSIREVVYGERLEAGEGGMEEAFGRDGMWEDEIEIATPEGPRTLHVLANRFHNEKGEPAGRIWMLRDITKRKAVQDALRESQERYRAVVENQTDLICRLSADGRVIFANEAYARYYGRRPEELVGTWIGEHIPKEDRIKDEEHLNRLTPQEPVAAIEHRTIVDGQIRWQHWIDKAIFDEHGEVLEYQSVGRDITDRKKAEEKLVDTERALRALSACTQAVIHIPTEQELLDEVCRIIVRDCGYCLAWIGYAEDDKEKSVRLKAREGMIGPPEEMRITWKEDDPYGQGPTGRAIREGQPQIAKDLLDDPELVLWRERAVLHGYRSSAAFPLRSGAWTIGALNVYAAEEDAFDPEETDLLQRLADELAYAIGSLRQRAAEERVTQALFESEEKYRELVESANSIINRATADGTILYLNRFALDFFGYTEEELVGRNVSILLPRTESTGRDLESHLQDILERPEEFTTNESEVVLRNGERRWVSWANRAIRDEAGNIREILAIGNDITPFKRAQEALKSSQEKLQRIFDEAPVGIELFDAGGTMTECNPAALAIFGLDKSEDLVGFNFFSDATMGDATKAKLRNGENVRYEAMVDFSTVKYRTGKTGKVHVEIQGLVLKSAQGITGYMFLVQDITRHRQIEEVLRRHSQEFRALSENAPDGIERFDREFRHLYLNPAAERIDGIPRESAIGKTDRELGMPEELVQDTERAIREVFQTGREQKLEFSVPGGDGMRHYDARLSPEMAWDGSVETVLMISHDITGHKLLEEALKRAHETLEDQVRERTKELQESNRKLEIEIAERAKREDELQEANRAIAESEQRYRTIIEANPSGVIIVQDDSISYVNPAGVKLYGAENPKQIVGRDPLDFVHPMHRESSRERMSRGTGKTIPSREARIVRLDGRIIDVEVRGRWIEFQGRPALLGIIRDITERKEHEAQVVFSNTLLSLRNDAAGIQEYVEGVNRHLQKLVGCSRAALLLAEGERLLAQANIGFPESLWEKQQDFFRANDQPLRFSLAEGGVRIETGRPDVATRKLPKFLGKKTKKDKDAFYAELRKRNILDLAVVPICYRDTVIGSIHLADDLGGVTAEKIKQVEDFVPLIREAVHEFQLEGDLRRNNELMEKVFDTTYVHLAYLDKDYRFIRVNEAYAADEGKEPGYFVGKSHNELYPDVEIVGILRSVMETGEPYRSYGKPFDNPQKPERGTTYWDWIVQPVRDGQGKIGGLLLGFMDVTERMRMEEKLLESYKRLGVINRQVSILLDMNRQGGGRNTSKILKYIIGSAVNLSQAKIVSLYEYRSRGDELALIASSDQSAEADKRASTIQIENYGFLLPLVGKKVRVQGMFSKKVLRKLNIADDVKYFLFLPLLIGKKLKGALLLGFAEREAIVTQELDFYEAYAAQASFVLQNLKIFK